MSKILVLRQRQPNPNVVGHYLWHDFYVLTNAIGSVAKGKDLGKLAPWISVAGKMQQAADEVHIGKLVDSETLDDDNKPMRIPTMVEFSIKLKNQEATLLWKELSKAPWESFGNNIVPNPGVLYMMLCDIAQQLGEKVPEADEDEKSVEN